DSRVAQRSRMVTVAAVEIHRIDVAVIVQVLRVVESLFVDGKTEDAVVHMHDRLSTLTPLTCDERDVRVATLASHSSRQHVDTATRVDHRAVRFVEHRAVGRLRCGGAGAALVAFRLRATGWDHGETDRAE